MNTIKGLANVFRGGCGWLVALVLLEAGFIQSPPSVCADSRGDSNYCAVYGSDAELVDSLDNWFICGNTYTPPTQPGNTPTICPLGGSEVLYLLTNACVILTGFSDTISDLNVPDTIEGLPVVGMVDFEGATAYRYKTVTLPNTLTNIGKNAFSRCLNLTNVVLSTNLTVIGESAFKGCANLVRIEIPASVNQLGNGAFADCTALTDVYFDGNAPQLGGRDVFANDNLAQMHRMSSTTGWGETYGQRPMSIRAQSLTFEYTITEQGTVTITNYIGVDSVIVIPDLIEGQPVTRIGNEAFLKNGNLAEVVMGNNVTSIGTNAFNGCSGLTNLVLSTNLISIESAAFERCTGLLSITLPASVSFLDDNAFAYCLTLRKVHFLGNSPQLGGGGVLDYDWHAQVYYLPGSVGWTNTFCGLPASIWAQSLQFGYQLNDPATTVTITGYTGASETITIPDQIDGLPVTTIGSGVFANNSNLVQILIGNHVTNIGTSVFASCSGLSRVTLPSHLAAIGESAFAQCPALESIVLPDSVTIIGNSTFASCSGLINLVLSSNLSNIPHSAFQYCGRLESITLPDSVTNVDAAAFDSCTNLARVILSTNLASLGDFAFGYSSNLTDVTLPASMVSLGYNPFGGCRALTNISVDIENPWLADQDGIVFSKDLSKLVLFPTGRSGNYRVPDGTFEIGANCFALNEGIQTITIGPDTTAISTYAFDDCDSLQSLDVELGNPNYRSQDGVLFDHTGALLVRCPSAFAGNYVMPNSVCMVGTNAFYGCTNLTDVSFSRYVTNICESAFYNAGLVTVYLPPRLQAVEAYAFFCPNLGDVFFKSGNMPELDELWAYNFYFAPFHYAPIWHYPADSPDRSWRLLNRWGIQAYPWEYISTLGTIELSESTLAITNWADSMNVITVPGDIEGMTVVSITDYAFTEHAGLESITLPQTVTNIGAYAFSNCYVLTNISMPGSLTRIGEAAFAKCYKLPSITLPPGVDSIGASAFAMCTSLKAMSLPNGLTTISNNTFEYCKFVSIQLPESIVQIGPRAFANCLNLSMTYFPGRLATIGSEAFYGCHGLKSLVFPESLQNLGNEVFYSCYYLNKVTFEGNAPKLPGGAQFSDKVTIYYYADAGGWSDTYGGRPTVKLYRTTPFTRWADACGLSQKFPNACGSQDDADHDGMTNLQEMNAGTDPTSAKSALAFEQTAQPEDLSEEDKTPIDTDKFALYFQTVPGKTYDIETCDYLNGEWSTVSTVTATTVQKRAVLNRPAGNAFYRVVIHP